MTKNISKILCAFSLLFLAFSILGPLNNIKTSAYSTEYCAKPSTFSLNTTVRNNENYIQGTNQILKFNLLSENGLSFFYGTEGKLINNDQNSFKNLGSEFITWGNQLFYINIKDLKPGNYTLAFKAQHKCRPSSTPQTINFTILPKGTLTPTTFTNQMDCAPIRDLPTFNCYGKIGDDYIIPNSIKVKLATDKAINCHFINNTRNFGCDNIPATHLNYSRWAPIYVSINQGQFIKTQASVFVEKK